MRIAVLFLTNGNSFPVSPTDATVSLFHGLASNILDMPFSLPNTDEINDYVC